MSARQSINVKMSTKYLFPIGVLVLVLVLSLVDLAVSDYENTWNLYYEQPCCANINGHHIRHHRGNCNNK